MRRTFLLILVALLSVSCAHGGPTVTLRGETFQVEVADEPDEMALGLMFRTEMPADHGMIFIYPDEAQRSFWMKNTRLSLDILYFSSDLKLVDWYADVPPCKTPQCPSYPSRANNVRYVLELNAGKAAQIGVQKGDELTLNL